MGHRRYRLISQACQALAVSLLLVGCNDLECAVMGDNLQGRITFAEEVPIVPGARITYQWSKDSFTSVAGRSSVNNYDGLVTFSYSLCVENDVDFQVRAFQDTN